MTVDVIAAMVRRLDEMERRIANGERHGAITDVDQDKGMVKVSDGVWSSGWLAWREHNSNGGMKSRTMPTVGSAAKVSSHSGNLEDAFVAPSAYPTDTNQMPTGPDGTYKGEHIMQMGADDPSQGKQVKHTTDVDGNHKVAATDSHTKNVGDYTHTVTKDGGHVFTSGGTQPTKLGDPVSSPDFTYTQTKDGGHVMTNKAGHKYTLDQNGHKLEAGGFSYSMSPDGGHTLSAGGHTINLTSAGLLINATTAFSKDYGVGSAPGAISKIDDAIDNV